MNFYWFDAFILGFTLLLGLKGILNGLVKEIFGLIGIIGGVFLASKYANQVAAFIQNNLYKIENESLANFAGFLALLVLFWVVCLVFGNLFAKLIKLSGLGFLDKIGGFIFGGVKVFLIFAVLVFCITKIGFLNEKLNNFAQNSYTLPLLKETGSYIMNQPLAENSLEKVSENLQELTTDLNKDKGE